MANVNAVVVAKEISVESVAGGVTPSATLVVGFALLPLNGGVGINENVTVTLALSSTAAQWKTAIVNALKAFAAAPTGSPDVYTISRLIGLIDIATVVP